MKTAYDMRISDWSSYVCSSDLDAALRFAVVAMVMWPWLLPMPRPAWRIVAIALCLGGGSFSLLFVGLQTVSPSEAAIILQLGVPFTMLLSVLVLGERIY